MTTFSFTRFGWKPPGRGGSFSTTPMSEKFSTHLFNPLLQSSLRALSIPQYVQVFLNALGLWYGQGYGTAHFSAVSRTTLLNSIRPESSLNATDGCVRTFDELRKRLRTVVRDNRDLSGALELLTVVEDLAGILPLNITDDDNRISKDAKAATINFTDLFVPDDHGQYPVVYFYLRAGDEIAGAHQVMKLALYALKNARQHLHDLWKLSRHEHFPPVVPVFWDEWQTCADESIKNLLEQGAGLGIHLVLANQDPSQLRTKLGDLLPTVWENCASKLIFSARDVDLQERIMKASGEKTVHKASWRVTHDDLRRGNVSERHAIRVMNDGWEAVQITEEVVPRLGRNDLIEMSNDPRRCVYFPAPATELADYGGYPIMIDTEFYHSPREYEYLSKLRWPAATAETIVF